MTSQPNRRRRLKSPDKSGFRPAPLTPIRHDLSSEEDGAQRVPSPLTSFVGRGRELAEIRRILGESRLLTLTGTGGVGKTRLALELARRVERSFPDGVTVVELATLSDSALVPRAVAAAVGVPEQPGVPSERALIAKFNRCRCLLLLDNCEHLVTACADLVGRLLSSAPGLRILATSRLPLGVASETTWQVPPMTLPSRDARIGVSTQVADVLKSEAVRLFEERARAVDPAFRVGERSADVIAEICERLDGIPLAIELAAARVRALTPEQIVERLEHSLDLLTRGARGAVPRQRTLRASIDWSYDLLSDRARALFCRASVFAGGWTLEPAEFLGADGAGDGDVDHAPVSPIPANPISTGEIHPSSPHEVLDLLADLVDASLVVADLSGGAARYRLLDTIRLYASERLQESGEDALARRLHRDWFLEFVEVAALGIEGPDQATWLDRLEAEHDNIRAALAWSVDEREAEATLRLCRAVFRFWLVRDYLVEGYGWITRAAALGPESTQLFADILIAAGRLADLLGDLGSADQHHRAGLAIATNLGYSTGIANAATQLGRLAREAGDFAAARQLYQQSIALRRELDQPRSLGIAINGLAKTALAEGSLEEARGLGNEALEIHRPLGHHVDAGSALIGLADVAIALGDRLEARVGFTEALTIGRTVGDRTMICQALEGLAELVMIDDPEQALRLAGAAATERGLAGLAPHYAKRPQLESGIASVRERLGRESSDALSTAAHREPIDAFIDRTLAQLSAPTSQGPAQSTWYEGDEPRAPHSDRPERPDQPLTNREIQVATLVSHGYTNRQVAADLVISELTAETHVRNVLRKLGFTTRAQIAAWAAELGLTSGR